MLAGVDPAYWPTAGWFMHANHALNLRTVVDSNGRPIINFENGFDSDSVTGQDYNSNSPVAKLLGFPVFIDNDLSGTLTASTTGGPIFGSLQHAMVQRVVNPGVRILRLGERYADYLAVGYLGFYRFDIRSNDLSLDPPTILKAGSRSPRSGPRYPFQEAALTRCSRQQRQSGR